MNASDLPSCPRCGVHNYKGGGGTWGGTLSHQFFHCIECELGVFLYGYSYGHRLRVWVERDYSGYHEKIVTASSGLCWLSLEVDSPSRHNPPPFHASGQMRFSLLRTESPPSCIPAELIERLDKALLDGKKYTKMAYDLGSRLQCEQTLRTELRGEMLNKVLATQAPEIAKLFPDLVGAEVKALTVIEHEG